MTVAPGGSLRIFIEVNGWTWASYPGVDESEAAVLAVTNGERDEQRTALGCENS